MSHDGRRAGGWATMAAGLGALLVAVVLLLRPAHAPADVGGLPLRVVAPASAPAPSRTAAALWTPDALTIGGRGVAAPVDAVGVTRDGALDVPADPSRLGWWIGSSLPGERSGTVLIAGHVDTARDGRGVLYRLASLPMGSRVSVRAGDRTVLYRLTARRSYPKSRLPKELFRRDGAARLVLVTCGGAFHDGTYADNVVVYATPQ